MSYSKNNGLTIIGPFPPPYSGTSIKNLTLRTELELANVEVRVINTAANRVRAILDLLVFTFSPSRRELIIAVSINGRRLLIPYGFLATKLFRKMVVLMPCGGTMADDLIAMPVFHRRIYTRACNSFARIYAETQSMTNSLRQVLPQANVALMYNFKRRPIAPAKMPRTATQPLLHLAYLGRLREEKGIFFLIAAAKLLMQSKVGINLHFYGDFLSRDKEVEMRFYESIKSADFIEYKGYLAAEEIQATLGNYDMLVFPTYYPGEGFPGVLIDAAFAGIPVVATDFAYNAELVIDGVTGVLCSPRNADSLAKAIASFYDNQRCLAMLGENAWSRSERFDSALAVVRLLRVFRLSPNEEER